nr:MAG TPA: hypothetical protein [Bacteriophage sp.]
MDWCSYLFCSFNRMRILYVKENIFLLTKTIKSC